jgi:hypothetical protein
VGQEEGLKERSRKEGNPSTPPPCISPEKPTLVEGIRGYNYAKSPFGDWLSTAAGRFRVFVAIVQDLCYNFNKLRKNRGGWYVA